MRLNNLIQLENLPNLHLHRPRLNLLQQIVQRRVLEFFWPAVVGRPVTESVYWWLLESVSSSLRADMQGWSKT
jgi:hypothetical protein